MSLKKSFNFFFFNYSEILLKSSGPWAGDVGSILCLQDHCQFKVTFDLDGEKKNKITELQIFYFSKYITREVQIIPSWKSGLNEDFKKDFFLIMTIINVYCRK